MKRIITLSIAILLSITTANAQSSTGTNDKSSARGRNVAAFTVGDTEVGVYAGVATKYTTIFGEHAGLLELRGAFTVDRRWSIGLVGAGLWYDKSLHELVDDGSYRIEMAYGGIFVERMFSLSDHFILSLSVASGQGEVRYIYDKEYRDEKTWTEETIDRTTFAFFEPTVGMQVQVSDRVWLGVSGSYRNTSPVQLIGTDEDVFRKFSGGLTLTYGVF